MEENSNITYDEIRDIKNIGERFRYVRLKMNIEISEICKDLNIHRNTIYYFETGKTSKTDLLEDLCEYVGVDILILTRNLKDFGVKKKIRNANIGMRIKHYRLLKSYSIGKLSSESGVDSSTIQCAESGKYLPTLHVVKSIAKSLDITPQILIKNISGYEKYDISLLNIMKNPNFGQRVKMLRNKRLMTRAELAEEAGVSVQQIYKIEVGDDIPSSYVIDSLCLELNIGFRKLINNTCVEEAYKNNYYNMKQSPYYKKAHNMA